MNNFQLELAQQVSSLCNTVTSSLSQQNEHLECVENLCHSFLGFHDKVRKLNLLPLLFLLVTFFHGVTQFLDSFLFVHVLFRLT